ncbi:MAG: hypothetical protein NC120_03695 [Ruminococcus sp.]|nr:hypothetical protein [Ruminococcus sp.]
MKNILISCVSLFTNEQKKKDDTVYFAEDITVSAKQTNEACVKFLLKKLARDGRLLDTYIRVQSNGVERDGNTMQYLDGSIAEFCKNEALSVPAYFDCFLGDDDKAHRYDRVLSEISREILKIAGSGPDVSIYLDMAGGKRDNYIFIQLLTKLLSFYGFDVHSYYADITEVKVQGTIVNTDLSFRHMKILDAVNEFIRFGSVTALRNCFSNSESTAVKTLLKAMEDFSNSLQLCSTDLANVMLLLNQQLDQIEKYVSYDKDDLFVIGTMIPLIRQKFDIKADNGSREALNIIKWCLENNLVQQALTIYNEKAVDLIIGKKIIAIDEKLYGNDIKRMMYGKHPSKRNNTKLLFIVGKAFEKMYKDPSSGTKEMERSIGKYKGIYKNCEYDKNGNIVCHQLEWTIGSVFFSKDFLPDGVEINIDDELCRKILSDVCFAVCARNRVNHASDTDTYGKLLTSLFYLSSYPFSSYPNTFTPKNIKKDLLRAVENLEDALDIVGA